MKRKAVDMRVLDLLPPIPVSEARVDYFYVEHDGRPVIHIESSNKASAIVRAIYKLESPESRRVKVQFRKGNALSLPSFDCFYKLVTVGAQERAELKAIENLVTENLK